MLPFDLWIVTIKILENKASIALDYLQGLIYLHCLWKTQRHISILSHLTLV